MRWAWEQHHFAFLREGYKQLNVEQLTEAFNEYFRCRLRASTIRTALRNHNIVSGRPPSSGVQQRVFSAEHLAFLREGYRHFALEPLTQAFNAHYGRQVTVSQVRCATRNHNIKSGRNGRFTKGIAPWNNGTKGVMKANAGTFRKGNRPQNWLPVGSEVTDRDGYRKVKVAEPNRWKFKHRLVWEQTHGPIPRGMVVSFRDGDKMNCSPDNLELIDRGLLAQYNKQRATALPAEIQATAKTLVKLRVATSRRARKTT